MSKTRKRIRQSISLEERLGAFTHSLRKQVKALAPNSEEALRLRQKIRASEAALRISAALCTDTKQS